MLVTTAYLFAFFSSMSVTDTFDFQMGSTRSWVRLIRDWVSLIVAAMHDAMRLYLEASI